MEIGAFLGIGAAALGLVLTPGPNMIYLVSRSITQGAAAGLISLLGVAVGFFSYLLAATLGITAMLRYAPAAYSAITIAGAGYLLYLAWRAVRPGGTSAFQPGDLPRDRPWRLFTMGLVTNLLNPKIAILYVSLLPQFVNPAAGSVALQSVYLGLTQIAIAVTVNALIVLTAGSIATFLTARPRWLRAQRYAMGAALALIAVMLLGQPPSAPSAGPVPPGAVAR